MNDHETELTRVLTACRESVGLSTTQMAARSGLATSAVHEMEAGTAPADWRLVDALVDELDAQGFTHRSRQIIALRSRVEAPLHGVPGTLCLCYAEDGTHHWLRRGRGQIYCGTHGQFLIPSCYGCGYRYSELTAEAYRCPGCNMPIEAMLESLWSCYEGEFEQDESETLAAARMTWSAQTENQVLVRRQRPLTQHEVVAAHNRAREFTVEQLSGRARDHYVAARTISDRVQRRAFSRSELLAVYLELLPEKAMTTVLPSDFCLHANKAAAENPWFLIREQRGRYVFVGLDGNGDHDINIPTVQEEHLDERA